MSSSSEPDSDSKINEFHEDLEIISSEIRTLAISFSEDIEFKLYGKDLSDKFCLRDIISESLNHKNKGSKAHGKILLANTIDDNNPYQKSLLKFWNLKKGKFLEVLCFLAKLKTFKQVGFQARQLDLSKPTGGINVWDGDKELFIWYLASTAKTTSRLRAIPDI